MSAQIYSKKEVKFKVSPNLADYEAINAVDRHIKTIKKDKIALIWEGAKGEKKQFTFHDLYKLSNKFANLIKSKGTEKGDRVFIFLPRIPYLYASFLAILKNGSIAGLLFSAFQEQALLDRLADSGAKILITNTELSKRLENIR